MSAMMGAAATLVSAPPGAYNVLAELARPPDIDPPPLRSDDHAVSRQTGNSADPLEAPMRADAVLGDAGRGRGKDVVIQNIHIRTRGIGPYKLWRLPCRYSADRNQRTLRTDMQFRHAVGGLIRHINEP